MTFEEDWTWDWKGFGLDWIRRRTVWVRPGIVEDGTWTGPDLDWKGLALKLDSHSEKLQDDFEYGQLFV